MKRLTFLLLFLSVFFTSFAKKDTDAWKKETSLNEQYTTFKANLNFWSGSYFLTEKQLSEFYSSLSDTISEKQKSLDEARSRIGMLNAKIAEQDKRNADTEEKLAKSTKLQNSISLLGINVEKHVYSVILFLIIAGVLVLAGFVFMLYKKSVSTTRTLKKDYEELKEEYEAHKKSALERYTQTNMELHRTRLELQKKK